MGFCRQGILVFAALTALSVPAAFAGSDAAPSFDCAKASSPDEKAICADPELAAIDVLITAAFKDFKPAYGGDKKAIGRALLADRKQCGAERACIAAAESSALQTYGYAPSWVAAYTEGMIGHKAMTFAAAASKAVDQPMPKTLGQCALTHIAALTTRLGEDPLESADPSAGSLVRFSNDGIQVSYDRDYGLANSQAGDPVVVCLITIPRDCPAGDERGRVYYGVDLNLRGSWVLPDSQHMCGGA